MIGFQVESIWLGLKKRVKEDAPGMPATQGKALSKHW